MDHSLLVDSLLHLNMPLTNDFVKLKLFHLISISTLYYTCPSIELHDFELINFER